MHQIGQQFDYKSWEKIQEYLVDFFEVEKITNEEIDVFQKFQYKKFPKISYKNLINVGYFYPNHLNKDVFEKINTIELGIKNTNKNNPLSPLFIINENYKLSPSFLYFFFKCCSCDKRIELSYNPARMISSFNIPICKNCKKSILHKCEDYTENYENSMMNLYGAKRPFQSKQIFDSFKELMIERYGVPFSGMSPDLLNKSLETTKKRYDKKSWIFGGSQLEENIVKEIKKLIDSRYSLIEQSNKKQGLLVAPKHYLYPDLVIKEIKTIVEVFGDYWHCNPLLYDSSFVSKKGLTRDEVNAKDKNRIQVLENLGYTVIVIWENDWYKNKQKEIQRVIDVINSKNFQF